MTSTVCLGALDVGAEFVTPLTRRHGVVLDTRGKREVVVRLEGDLGRKTLHPRVMVEKSGDGDE